MEPSQADVAAVSQAMGEQPTTQPQQPAQQPSQPTQPTQQTETPAQPAQPTVPTEPVDPFASIFAQPTEVAQPIQPTEPTAPAQPATPAETQQPQYDDYNAYIDKIMQGLPQPAEQPDPEKVDANNPEDIKSFFDDLVNTAVSRAEANLARKEAIHNSERKLWDEAFNNYGTLRTNKAARDTVHAIRMAHFNKGVAITPTQAAKLFVDSLGDQYRKGIADNQVVTTIEQVQPNGGGANSVETSLGQADNLRRVQTGGEQALTDILDAQIRAGKL